ncbi:MAG: GNAT family N-acetyltransferase [Solirubrobacterales bacterium]
MSFIIRKANFGDINNVEKLYDNVLDFEAENGSYTNWQKGLYPTRKYAETAISLGSLYVGIENGEMVGSVILNHIQPEEYIKVDWKFEAEGNDVMVIHTLCINPRYRKMSLGTRFVDFSEELARSFGCSVIRLDTYEGNIPAAALYSKLGYRYSGSVEVNFQNVIFETLKCFEKEMKNGQ